MVKVERYQHNGRICTRYIEEPYAQWIMAADLGQRHDYTAITAIEHTRVPLDEWEADEAKATTRQKVEEQFAVRGLRRLPLGMDYNEQGERIRQLLLAPPICGQADLVIDDAGVGAPVGDIVVKYGQLNPVRVTLSGTAIEAVRHAHRKYTVPKIELISNLDARFATKELKFADDIADREALEDELTNFQRHMTVAGRATFEARGSKHDDIVLSTGMALWWAIEKRRFNKGSVGSVRGLY